MTCDELITIGVGRQVLARVTGALAVLAFLVLCGFTLTTEVPFRLLSSLLVLTGLLLVYRVLLFGFRPLRRNGGWGRIGASSAERLIRAIGVPLQAGRRMERELSTEIRRFRITEVSGRVVECELTGELAGAHLRQGDVVEVYGRRTRQGIMRAREVVIVANQARVRGRPNFAYVFARCANVVALVLAGVCVLGVVYVVIIR